MAVAAIIEKRASATEAVHGTLPERTYTQLRNMIVRGRIGPGARIVEEEVALRFGVSRTPVREAIARLVNEGYLTSVAGKRRTEVAVAPLSSQSVEELWGMIGALEGHTIRGIARLPANRRAHLAVDLEKLNLELRRASRARPRDHDRLFELQAEFHQRFMDESAGVHLLAVYSILRPQVQRYEWVYGTSFDAEYEPSTNEHLQIISAVRSGDGNRAREAVERHWEHASVRTIAIVNGIEDRSEPRRREAPKDFPRKRPR